MKWQDIEGIDILDKPIPGKRPSGIRAYRYAPTEAKNNREIVAIRRYYVDKNGELQGKGWRGPSGYHPSYCPIELYQIDAVIEALRKLQGEKEEKKVDAGKEREMRRFMR